VTEELLISAALTHSKRCIQTHKLRHSLRPACMLSDASACQVSTLSPGLLQPSAWRQDFHGCFRCVRMCWCS
jgi:hypothetical protein